MIDSFYRTIHLLLIIAYEHLWDNSFIYVFGFFFFFFVEEKELKARITELWKYRESGITKMDGKFLYDSLIWRIFNYFFVKGEKLV